MHRLRAGRARHVIARRPRAGLGGAGGGARRAPRALCALARRAVRDVLGRRARLGRKGDETRRPYGGGGAAWDAPGSHGPILPVRESAVVARHDPLAPRGAGRPWRRPRVLAPDRIAARAHGRYAPSRAAGHACLAVRQMAADWARARGTLAPQAVAPAVVRPHRRRPTHPVLVPGFSLPHQPRTILAGHLLRRARREFG